MPAARTESEAFNALCRLLGERIATDETEERTALELLADLESSAAENGESVANFAARLYGLD